MKNNYLRRIKRLEITTKREEKDKEKRT